MKLEQSDALAHLFNGGTHPTLPRGHFKGSVPLTRARTRPVHINVPSRLKKGGLLAAGQAGGD